MFMRLPKLIRFPSLSASVSVEPADYEVTVTEELDADYLKYLRRKIRPHQAPESVPFDLKVTRLDVSLEDDEGDVIAGLAAWTHDERLVIDLIWVDEARRGYGFGRKLVEMAEAVAVERGCTSALVTYAPSPDLYLKLGYSVTTQLMQFPSGQSFFRLQKTLDVMQPECQCEHCECSDDDYPDYPQNKDEQPTCFAS